jgi:hypothetical protein
MFEALEKALDRFFAAPIDAWNRFADRFFEYQYRETTNGVFGLFDSPEKLKEAAKKSVSTGYTNFDCLSPFPIHGLEHDMGLNRSKIPYVTFVFGLIGTTLAFMLQFVIHEQVSTLPYFNSYPLNIGGKPTFAWPAMIPVMFELTILLGGISTVVAFFALSKIPRPSRKPLHKDITNDKFALWIPSDSANYSEDGVKKFLGDLGAQEITVVNETK